MSKTLVELKKAIEMMEQAEFLEAKGFPLLKDILDPVSQAGKKMQKLYQQQQSQQRGM